MGFKSIGQVANYKPLSRCNMEELAMHQRTIAPSGGVMFARKSLSEEKDAARQRVIELFSPGNWDGRLNMLTMPGVRWRFERMLLGAREDGWARTKYPKHTHFTGVENDRAIYFAAATKMPGIETPGRLVKPVKPGRFAFAEIAIKTRFASFFFADMDDFLQHPWEPAPYRDLVGWDAAWLDYTGPLTTQRLRLIRNFYDRCVRHILIVTALKARWNRQTSDAIAAGGGHQAWLQKSLPGQVLHYIEYSDSSPMAQIALRKETA